MGLENQTLVDNDMIFRVLGYDGQSYRSQLLDKSVKQRFPVTTLVLYFGNNHWNGPRTLYEALDIPDNLKPYISDYKINVFEIAWLTDDQVQKFVSDFKIVADYFVQVRKNKDYRPSGETIKHVDAILKLMSVLTDDERFTELQEHKDREVSNMCEVLDRAINMGIEQGIEQGVKQGIKQGVKQGIEQGKIKNLIDLLSEGIISYDIALEKSELSKVEFDNLLNKK